MALAILPDGDVQRRRQLAKLRAVAFARLSHTLIDLPG
jgi:hypothetical protein